jgi:hypothetical protein
VLTESKPPQLTSGRAKLLVLAALVIYGVLGNSVASEHRGTLRVIIFPAGGHSSVLLISIDRKRHVSNLVTKGRASPTQARRLQTKDAIRFCGLTRHESSPGSIETAALRTQGQRK